jgi:hypothetical protein
MDNTFAAMVTILGLVVCVAWIAFPFIVNSNFTKLLKGQRETNALLSKLLAVKEKTSTEAREPSVERLIEEKKPEATPTVPAVSAKKEPDVYRI